MRYLLDTHVLLWWLLQGLDYGFLAPAPEDREEVQDEQTPPAPAEQERPVDVEEQ